MGLSIATNDAMKLILASAYVAEDIVPAGIDVEPINRLVECVAKLENGLYVFMHPDFGPGKYSRYSDSALYDNGGATSFRLRHFVANSNVGASSALWAATRLSKGVFSKLKALGVEDAGAVLCLAYDEPGDQDWDYRFYAGKGAGAVANGLLTADQAVAIFRSDARIELP